MKKIFIYGAAIAVCAAALSSCNCFKKMAATSSEIGVVANPGVLTLVGNEIVTDVTVTFPAKYYHPKAIVRVTPVLVFEGGVIEGAPKFFQGESVRDNYTVIPRGAGGVVTQRIAFPWDPRAARSVLELRIEGKCSAGADFQPGGTIRVAEGVNTLQSDLAWDDAMTITPDNFKRVTHDSRHTDLMYAVNASNVRKGELTKEQTRLFEQFVRENENKDRVTLGNIQAKGYASPEGPVGFNDQLSKKRSESGKAAVAGSLKGMNYDIASYGEDWEGFKALVEASDMKDKDLIIHVLNQFSSSAQRDSEIRNMSQVFNELKNQILPQLRRTQMVASIDIQGKSDEELKAAVKDNLTSLNLEEMLFAATLADCNKCKVRIYTAAAEKYNDARAWNNLGIAQAGLGNWKEAEGAFRKATEISSNPAVANNLAVVALAEGDAARAAKYLPAAGAQARALAAITEGNYAAAASQLTGYNKAVAETLAGNLNAAKNALVGDDSARADYLRAVVAAKEGNTAAALASVRKAIEKAPAMKAKAAGDINLATIAGQI